MLKAIHLASGNVIEQDSISSLFKSIGVDRRGYYRIGQPKIYCGWNIKIPEGFSGKRSVDFSSKKQSVPITVTYTDTGKQIEYSSISDAARDLGIDSSHISAVLKGLRSRYGILKFDYLLEESLLDLRFKFNRSNKGLHLILEKEGSSFSFSSTIKASEFLWINVESLRRAIRLRHPKIKGYSLIVGNNETTFESLLLQIHRYLKNRNDYPDSRKWNSLSLSDLEGFDTTKGLSLFSKWKESNFDFNFKPLLDRIDPSKGYSIENIQWLTFRENLLKSKKDCYILSRDFIWYISSFPEEFYDSYSQAEKVFRLKSLNLIQKEDRPYICIRRKDENT